MSEIEPKTLRDEYSQATKILDAEYKPESLESTQDVIQKYEHLFDETLGESKMDPIPISLQLMDPNC
jgi:hypothetical protein